MPRPSALARWIAGLLAAGAGLAALGLGVLFIQAARLPYNLQGRHFEDGVVHHAQSLPVYGVLALTCLSVALLLAWWARR